MFFYGVVYISVVHLCIFLSITINVMNDDFIYVPMKL